MSYTIDQVEGIGTAYTVKLTEAGIGTTADLLTACATRAGREELSQQTGISPKLILTWSNQADLMRLAGIGPQFSELLQAAGVDTVKELRRRNATNLEAKLREVNAVKHLAKSTPTEAQVSAWIAAASSTDPILTY